MTALTKLRSSHVCARCGVSVFQQRGTYAQHARTARDYNPECVDPPEVIRRTLYQSRRP